MFGSPPPPPSLWAKLLKLFKRLITKVQFFVNIFVKTFFKKDDYDYILFLIFVNIFVKTFCKKEDYDYIFLMMMIIMIMMIMIIRK